MKNKKEKLGFNLILLGMIAAGKDTQANILMEKYALQPVESGKYFRKLSSAKTPDGEWLRRTTGKGHPTPVVLVKKFIVEQLAKKQKSKDFLFIGNPRLKPEAQLLNKLLKERKENYFALYVDLPSKEVYKRSFSRKTGNMPAYSRMLDSEKLIVNRIKYSKNQVFGKTVPYFKSLKKIKIINGNQSIEKVNEDIEKAIAQFKKQK